MCLISKYDDWFAKIFMDAALEIKLTYYFIIAKIRGPETFAEKTYKHFTNKKWNAHIHTLQLGVTPVQYINQCQ